MAQEKIIISFQSKGSKQLIAALKNLKKAQDELSLAEAHALKIEGMKLIISANAQESGALFGSVGISEILESIHEKGHDFVKRSSIILSTGPIKEVGEFEVNVELHPEIVKSISIEVKAK